jgi:hypothetical protein
LTTPFGTNQDLMAGQQEDVYGGGKEKEAGVFGHKKQLRASCEADSGAWFAAPPQVIAHGPGQAKASPFGTETDLPHAQRDHGAKPSWL